MSDAAAPSPTSGSSAGCAAEPPEEDLLGEVDALAHELPISIEAIHGNSFVASKFNVRGDFIIGSDERRSILPVVDVTAVLEDPRHPLIDSPRLSALAEMLERDRLVALTGHGAGKRTSALMAMNDIGLRPLLQVPGDIPLDDLADGISRLCRRHPTAGILIDAIDVELLGRLAGFKLTQVKAALGGTAALALTTDARTTGLTGLSVFECTPPDPAALAEAIVRGRNLGDDVLARAHEALRLFPEPISPSIVLAVIEAARDPESTAEAIAHVVLWSPDVLNEWLAVAPTAGELASMAAAASLEGVPTDEAEIETGRLSERLEPSAEADGAKRFRARNQTWPAGVIDVETRTFGSHFGRHEVEVLSFCPPHTRERVIAHLWRQLGSDFRRPYLSWLVDLVNSPSPRIRSAAAITAGALFMTEPLMTERELLRPWALADRASVRRCAGVALGVPVALGGQPAPARTLANAWATGDNLRFRHCAVVAYGGLLGAWDPSSAAALHLWHLGDETPPLRADADLSLAGLTSAGAEASRARASVFELLAAASEFRDERRRVYGVLPLIMSALTAPHPLARVSLMALLGEQEMQTFQAFAELLALAFDSASGFQSARAVTRVLLAAMTESRIEPEASRQIIGAVRDAAGRRGRMEAFGSALGRVLRGEGHRDSPLRDAANTVMDTFYVRA